MPHMHLKGNRIVRQRTGGSRAKVHPANGIKRMEVYRL